MKLKEIIIKAIKEKDIDLIGKVVEYLSIERGLSYIQTYNFVNTICPIELTEWDHILFEYDERPK
jgi:hypothetical protein